MAQPLLTQRGGSPQLALIAFVAAGIAHCGGPRAVTVIHPDRSSYEGRSASELQGMCSMGDAGACTALGTALLDDADTVEEYARIRDLFGQACEAGDMFACNELGVLWARGDGGDKDAGEAKALFGRSCDGGDCAGCIYLAEILDQSKALAEKGEVLEQSCDLGCSTGCEELAYHWYRGDGSPPDGTEAATLYGTICAGTSQHPFCPDVQDTSHVEECKDQCLFDEDECLYLASDALDACELACDKHQDQASYDSCMGTCGYKHKLAREACLARVDKCSAGCDEKCGAYGCD